MDVHTVDRDTWVDLAKQAGLRLEVLAVRTGKSYSCVYRYSTGTRRPSDEWIAKVADILAETAP